MKYNPHKVVYPFPFSQFFLKTASAQEKNWLVISDYSKKLNSEINFAHNWM